MIKYFRFLVDSLFGISYTDKEEVAERINVYALENNLDIVQICSCDDNGLFVLFKENK